MRRLFRPQLLALLVLPLVLAGCSGLRISFSPNPIVLTPDATEIVGTVTVTGTGIGSVYVDKIVGVAYYEDDTEYRREELVVKRNVPTFFGSFSREIRISLEGVDFTRLDRVELSVSGDDPGTLIIPIRIEE